MGEQLRSWRRRPAAVSRHTEHTREVVRAETVPPDIIEAIEQIGRAVIDLREKIDEIDRVRADHDALVHDLREVGRLAEALKAKQG